MSLKLIDAGAIPAPLCNVLDIIQSQAVNFGAKHADLWLMIMGVIMLALKIIGFSLLIIFAVWSVWRLTK